MCNLAGLFGGRPAILIFVGSIVPFVAGCVPFTWTTHEPALIEAHETQLVAIQPGQTTRAEVLELLGQPWLSNAYWRFDVYRETDYERVKGVVTLVLIPIYSAGNRSDWESYALITWDDDDVVSALATATVVRDDLTSGRGQLILRAREINLASNKPHFLSGIDLVLWVQHDRLQRYLEERTESGACTVLLACDRGKLCPTQVIVDDSPPFDPAFLKLFCSAEDHCAGAEPDPQASKDADRPVFRKPLLHPVELAPGEHRIGLGDQFRDRAEEVPQGTAEVTFNCPPGQVLFARVHAEAVGQSFWHGLRLQLSTEIVDTMPPDWRDYGVVLWRADRWFISPRGQ